MDNTGIIRQTNSQSRQRRELSEETKRDDFDGIVRQGPVTAKKKSICGRFFSIEI